MMYKNWSDFSQSHTVTFLWSYCLEKKEKKKNIVWKKHLSELLTTKHKLMLGNEPMLHWSEATMLTTEPTRQLSAVLTLVGQIFFKWGNTYTMIVATEFHGFIGQFFIS